MSVPDAGEKQGAWVGLRVTPTFLAGVIPLFLCRLLPPLFSVLTSLSRVTHGGGEREREKEIEKTGKRSKEREKEIFCWPIHSEQWVNHSYENTDCFFKGGVHHDTNHISYTTVPEKMKVSVF